MSSKQTAAPVKFSKEFSDLVKAVGECKSKSEEDRIVLKEVEVLKNRLTDPRIDRSRLKEYMVRLIYVETLGHDASFGYIHAVKLCSDSQLVFKKVGYVASALFLHEQHELILLLINTISRDLRSDNFLIVCAALEAVSKLINSETIPAVLPAVLDLTSHPREGVRKKAAASLHRFLIKAPYMREELDRPIRTLLCDKDPSVMAAVLPALHEAARLDPPAARPLAPSLVSILRQVLDHRLPKTYDYHKQPAPFIQIRLLKLLATLGRGDRAASEHMWSVLLECLRKALSTGNTIGNAIAAEVIRTAHTIAPNPGLLSSCSDALGLFLRPQAPHNLRYAGIGLMSEVAALSGAEVARQHQMAVIECLEDPDESLHRRTLDLLARMCNPDNAAVIVDRLLGFMGGGGEEEAKTGLAPTVYRLAESYAPSAAWFLSVSLRLLKLVPPGPPLTRLQQDFVSAVMEGGDEALRREALRSFISHLSEPKCPAGLLRVCVWGAGELTSLLARPGPGDTSAFANGSSSGGGGGAADPADVARRLAAVAAGPVAAADEELLGVTVTALAKVLPLVPGGPPSVPGAAAVLRAAAASRSTDLQQRAAEADIAIQAAAGGSKRLLGGAFAGSAAAGPAGGPALLEGDEGAAALAGAVPDSVDESLSFLDQAVQEALSSGAKPYRLPEDRQRGAQVGFGLPGMAPDLMAGHGNPAAGNQGALRFEAYQPAAPVPVSVNVPVPVSQGGAGGSGLGITWGAAAAAQPAAPAAAASQGSAGSASGFPSPAVVPGDTGAASASAAAAAAAPGPSAAAAAPTPPGGELRLAVNAGPARKWGPARFEEAPRPAPPAPIAIPTPAASGAAPGGGTNLIDDLLPPSPGALAAIAAVAAALGETAPQPSASALTRPPQVAQPPPVSAVAASQARPAAAAVDPEKARLAGALFGGGGAGGGFGIRRPQQQGSAPGPAAQPPAAQAPQPGPAPSLFDALSAPPPPQQLPQPQPQPQQPAAPIAQAPVAPATAPAPIAPAPAVAAGGLLDMDFLSAAPPPPPASTSIDALADLFGGGLPGPAPPAAPAATPTAAQPPPAASLRPGPSSVPIDPFFAGGSLPPPLVSSGATAPAAAPAVAFPSAAFPAPQPAMGSGMRAMGMSRLAAAAAAQSQAAAGNSASGLGVSGVPSAGPAAVAAPAPLGPPVTLAGLPGPVPHAPAPPPALVQHQQPAQAPHRANPLHDPFGDLLG